MHLIYFLFRSQQLTNFRYPRRNWHKVQHSFHEKSFSGRQIRPCVQLPYLLVLEFGLHPGLHAWLRLKIGLVISILGLVELF